MSNPETACNRVKQQRLAKGWSQEELAQHAGISRTGISAIEGERLVPSVAAALALARALDCQVEDLFGAAKETATPVWAWQPATFPCRYRAAEVGGNVLLFPLEAPSSGSFRHDGLAQRQREPAAADLARRTLVLATCDPAAGLLAEEYHRQTGYRLLVIPRSSREALHLLARRVIHVAGIHLARMGSRGGNAAAVRELSLDVELACLHVASWEEGLALSRAGSVGSVREALSPRLRWVGREEGAGARRCQDDLLGKRPAPRRIASSHQGVVEAVHSGWADLGVCQRLAAQEGGVRFLPICREAYDLCFTANEADELRMAALLRVVRSPEYQKLLRELPGYRPQALGEVEQIQ